MVGRKVLPIIVMMGIVSLFADITYEGARGVIPTYLTIILGAPVAVLGVVTGLGDFVGYGFRLVSGRLADVTRRYWTITFLGYFVNLVAIPLLAFAGDWQLAALLVVVERLGKAIRTPSRDLIISVAAKDAWRGKAFGVHEALDQIGAVAGPLIASLILLRYNQYSLVFLSFGLPAALAMLTLYATYRLYGKLEMASATSGRAGSARLSRTYWIYVAAVALSTVGFMHVAFILYRAHGVFADWFIPLLYLLAQAIDAFSGLLFGTLYDRIGLKVVAFGFPLTALVPIVALHPTQYTLVASALLFGTVLGMQETIQRAAVADLASVEMRGSAYGIFNAAFGFAWLAGGAIVGLLYELDFKLIIAYSVLLHTQDGAPHCSLSSQSGVKESKMGTPKGG
ncbi:MAG: MFS transporter [Candidatus Brockarchaeota archaeon]|nr:MFS transporter [Candidatus Brockarchaeota archaeon]